MFEHRELKIYASSNPEKTNVNPWDHSKTIKCMEILEKFHDCKEAMEKSNAHDLRSKCYQLRQFALYCFKLEPRYFIEATSDLLDEEAYLDLYMAKQMVVKKQNDVWKYKQN